MLRRANKQESQTLQTLETFDEELEEMASDQYPRAINATGVVLHTGLGRAPLLCQISGRFAAVSNFGRAVIASRLILPPKPKASATASCAAFVSSCGHTWPAMCDPPKTP